jgi:hypothetical protein
VTIQFACLGIELNISRVLPLSNFTLINCSSGTFTLYSTSATLCMGVFKTDLSP